MCFLLGMPDTSFSGLSTRTALRVRRSKSEPTVDRILQDGAKDRQTDRQRNKGKIRLALLLPDRNVGVTAELRKKDKTNQERDVISHTEEVV